MWEPTRPIKKKGLQMFSFYFYEFRYSSSFFFFFLLFLFIFWFVSVLVYHLFRLSNDWTRSSWRLSTFLRIDRCCWYTCFTLDRSSISGYKMSQLKTFFFFFLSGLGLLKTTADAKFLTFFFLIHCPFLLDS